MSGKVLGPNYHSVLPASQSCQQAANSLQQAAVILQIDFFAARCQLYFLMLYALCAMLNGLARLIDSLSYSMYASARWRAFLPV